MFRIWAKIFTENHLIKDVVFETNDSSLSRTQKIFAGIDQITYEFDLAKPIWLDSNISEFKRLAKTRFTKDNFIETIDFDYLELHIIEEDE